MFTLAHNKEINAYASRFVAVLVNVILIKDVFLVFISLGNILNRRVAGDGRLHGARVKSL